MTFEEVLQRFRDDSLSEREKGAKFEKLIRHWFLTDRRYSDQIKSAWLWEDFPYRESFSGNDIGIDIVIENKEGNFWAVQCKFYDEKTTIKKGQVDSFLSCVNKMFCIGDASEYKQFSEAFWIGTDSNWGKFAEKIIENQIVPFHRINYADLSESEVDWDELLKGVYGEQARNKPKTLMDYQVEAIKKAKEYYYEQEHNRGKLIMACGTGKTFTSLKMMESFFPNKGLILFMVPSIALLGQSLNAWKADSADEFTAICICSDNKASRKTDTNSDVLNESAVDLAVPACTNVKSITEQLLRARNEKGMVVVFSTYQSIDAVSEAQQKVLDETNEQYGVFDFIVCDEAHRTTGAKASSMDESNFVKIHNNDYIKGLKRLYMTATPKLFGDTVKKAAEEKDIIIWSMDDEQIYGEEFYRVGFSYAVQKGLLTDYKVLVLTVTEEELPEDIRKKIQDKNNKEYNTDDTLKLFGVINGLSKNIKGDEHKTWDVDPGMMKRAVAFCPKIGNAQTPGTSVNIAKILPQISEICRENLNEDHKNALATIETQHIDGGMNSAMRAEKISWLKADANDGVCRILTNVRCLSEGVDVPALDAVIFLSASKSQVDVVQSVGRVMRTFKKGQPDEKKYGYIIIPIVVPLNESPEDVLDNNERYKVVWDILNALRSHDESFNAQVNSINLNKKTEPKVVVTTPDGKSFKPGSKGKTIGTDNGSGDNGGVELTNTDIGKQLDLWYGEVKKGIYARIVKKCGNRFYWENWAAKMGKIAQSFIERITRMLSKHETSSKEYEAFEAFLKELRKNINPSVSEEDAIEMLAQHMITKPVFEALFEDYKFSENNVVSRSMQQMLDILENKGMEKDTMELDKFYKSVKAEIQIDNLEGKQRIIKTLYEKFFKATFPKVTEQLGIVYTPIECVDFMIKSIDDILRKEFNSCISDRGVHLLDPFTGTGTFIVRLLQSGLIKKEDLEYKYLNEIHCNEIMLLAYYVADINIEAAYHELSKEDSYLPYDGICLTDTFQLNESKNSDVFSQILKGNSDRVESQKKQPIMVCFGNPPYSIGQKSANDNAQNLHYPMLEQRVDCTYANATKVSLKKALYDSYIKAFRWASDRILLNDNDQGIIAFISNGGWLDGNAMDGMRKCLEEEFSSIYVLNLRGNCRTSGEHRRKEGDGIFGLGSRTPVTITFLVKNSSKKDGAKATIYYHDIGDYLDREKKLQLVKEFGSISKIKWDVIKPNDKFDWINQRGDEFDHLIPIEAEKKYTDSKSFFVTYSLGLNTGRAAWCFNFSRKELEDNINKCIDFYNKTVDEYEEAVKIDQNLDVVDFLEKNNKLDSKSFSWCRNQKEKDIPKFKKYRYDSKSLYSSSYRPFNKQNCYFNTQLNEMVLQVPKLFPTADSENLVISTKGVGDKIFSCLITDALPDLQLNFNGQCFPLYYYDQVSDKEQNDKVDISSNYAHTKDMFGEEFSNKRNKIYTDNAGNKYERKDGISNWILNEVKSCYKTNNINKEQIFYYVYGILHSKDYREKFDAELKKSLPKLPIVDSFEDFKAFEKAGRELANLHLNYENQQPLKEVQVTMTSTPGNDDYDFYKVEKLKFPKKTEKNRIIYNGHIVIDNIPDKVYEYVVNGKSAVEWIMDRYQVKIDKDSLIKNDPNDWSLEHGKPRYILDLLLSVMTVSVKTIDIVNNLPKLKF